MIRQASPEIWQGGKMVNDREVALEIFFYRNFLVVVLVVQQRRPPLNDANPNRGCGVRVKPDVAVHVT
jgi:hypothetical protein